MRAVGVLALAVVAVALGACGAEPADEAASAVTATTVDPSAGIDGPVMRRASADSGGQMDAPIRGTLELDGSCLSIRSSFSGERSLVIWPTGTAWDAATQAVVSPAGVAMPIGSEVSGGGGFFDDLTYVERVAGTAARDLAASCLAGTTGSYALVNDLPDAIGPAA